MDQAMSPPTTDIEAVLREHGPMLARIAGSYESEPARRDDLLQEISVAVWRALPSWRGDASLRTFAARVLEHINQPPFDLCQPNQCRAGIHRPIL